MTDEIRLNDWCNERSRSCNQKMEAIKETVHLIAKAHTEAINFAKKELDHRLSSMNNLQERMDRMVDQAVDRTYYEREHKELKRSLDVLLTWKAEQEGKSSWTNLMATLAILVSVLFGILHFVGR